MKYFQRLGRSLIFPVSVMPAASILIGIGYWIDPMGSMHSNFASFLITAGRAITDNLPVLFAVGIGYGMTVEKNGASALCALVGYLVVVNLLSVESVANLQNIPIEAVDLAFESSANAFIGILSGLVASFCYEHFSQVHLPNALAFFSGKRLVPIICAIFMVVLSVVLLYVWPVLYNALVTFGQSFADMGPLGAGIYAFFNRLLIPTGLHHALNSVFWFDVANINDVGRFWGTIDGGVKGVTGMYLAGFFPVMMFGLPGAALAMYQCARPEKKKKIASLMLAIGFSSFFTGITEPLEFSFMFVAPLLFLLHAFLTGIMVFIAASFQWIAGFSFSAGFVDFCLSINMPLANNIFMLIPLGIACGFIYYVTFRFCILKFNLMTPGREPDEKRKNIMDYAMPDELSALLDDTKYSTLARDIYEAVGGKENIIDVDSCVTRLRLEIRDRSIIDENKINQLSTNGFIAMGKHNIQIIIGAEVQFIIDEIIKLMGDDSIENS